MKSVHLKKHETDLESILINEKESTSEEAAETKVVITDECGDTLWDDILKHEEKNLLQKISERNGQSFNDEDKIKDRH